MFGNMGQLKDMLVKAKKLQDVLKNTIIRSKENGVVIDFSADMKVKDIKIEDESLLTPSKKKELEKALKYALEKAQNKAQEIASQKTEEILWFNPNDLGALMGGAKLPGL